MGALTHALCTLVILSVFLNVEVNAAGVCSVQSNGGLYFSGSTYVGLALTANYPTQYPILNKMDYFTVEMWFQTTSTDGILYRWRTYGQEIGVYGGKINGGAYVSSSTTSLPTIISNVTYNDGKWHHAALTYDGNVMNLYIDGQKSAPTVTYTGKTYYQAGASAIGRAGDEASQVLNGRRYYYIGNMAEVRVWNYSRSQAEVQNFMSTSIRSPTRNLILSMPMTDPTNPVRDYSGFGYHGTNFGTTQICTNTANMTTAGCPNGVFRGIYSLDVASYSCGRGKMIGPCNCVCESGYNGNNCEFVANPTCNSLAINFTEVSGRTPTIDTGRTKFENNTLTISLKSPQAKARTFTFASVEGSTDARCRMTPTVVSANGTYWSTGDFKQCQDELKMEMPWGARGACGFTLNTTADELYNIYGGKVLLSYADPMSIMENTELQFDRKTDLEFPVFVAFPKQLKISLQKMNVTVKQAGTYIEVALTGERYDTQTGNLALTLLSAVSYPTIIKKDSKIDISSTNPNVKVVSVTIGDPTNCAAPGQMCLQEIIVTLALVSDKRTRDDQPTTTYESSCETTFTGAYSVVTTLTACRENNTDCASSNVTVDFDFVSSSACATVFTMALPAVASTLKAYSTTDFTQPSVLNYKIGDRVFFALTVNGGTGNTLTIKFLDISYNDNRGSGENYLLRSGAPEAAGNKTTLTLATNYFSFYLTGAVFASGSSGSSSYTITARCSVTYLGNKKREVTIRSNYESDPSELASSARVVLRKAPSHDHKQHEPISDVTPSRSARSFNLITIVMASMGVTLFVVITVLFVIHRRAQQQNYERVPVELE